MTTLPEHWLHTPLAIIGMDCRLPGGDGLVQFWELLERGGSAIERMADSKLDRQLYFDARKEQRGKTYSDIGGFVVEREVDWGILNIGRDQASDWDPCHLNLCEVAARACRHAGFDPRNLPIKNTGVFVGHSGGTTLGGDLAYRVLVDEYLEVLAELPEFNRALDSPGADSSHAARKAESLSDLKRMLTESRPERRDGRPFVDAGFASGLISRNFGLTGPHFSIDAACASSLVALALGAMSLASGQTDMAIVGGASYNKADSLILFSAAQSCSSDASRPFDQDASGLISSEGYVAVLIKRLDRAMADGDNIHAVIRGIGISSDGRGRSLWAPRHEGQSTAIARAYPPEVSPSTVQMIEAHATSTQVGDATEMEALTQFYSQHLKGGQRIPVSSVKSNIGHTLETAGLAGLLKSVLAIQHTTVPPSINVRHPNESIPWKDIPFYIPQQSTPWPSPSGDQPRRAAINAFGIGGLNVHVVVDEWNGIGQPTAGNSVRSLDADPIAVVGRGLVVPGANRVEAYRELLNGARGVAQDANLPTQGNAFALGKQDPPVHRVVFEYDWRMHKVPPKQIAQANPLQFMLLEAADQALQEAGLHKDNLDRERTAVVVGSIFGGDFGNSLFAGLRLPEFRARLIQVLSGANGDAAQTLEVARAFEDQFLKNYPALLDETGSFTSSTLASRIAKTFNLMGGAMAIDAGDVSGLAALKSSCWLLQSGAASSVLCAAAQRALDRAALDNLRKLGRLPTENESADRGGQGYQIGEGVVLLALKRLSDARRDGNPILATIDSVALGFSHDNLETSIRNAASALNADASTTVTSAVGRLGIRNLDSAIEKSLDAIVGKPETPFLEPANLRITGHLQGAQGLLDIVNLSLDANPATPTIVGHTQSGQSAIVQITVGAGSSLQVSSSISQPQVHFFAANSQEDLKQQLASNHSIDKFSTREKRWVAAVVSSGDELPSKAKKFAAIVGNAQAFDGAIDQGMFWLDRQQTDNMRPRIAYMFSGQGSQYTGMMAGLVHAFPEAADQMARADGILRHLNQPSYAEMAWAPKNRLGEDVWHTQVSLLVANSMMARVLDTFGLQPDIVCGHSYGEIPAMWAAGCFNLETAIRLTLHRCQSVIDHAPSGCSMLSIHADESTVARIIASSQLPVSISHVNAPTQTVVGGKQVLIAQLAALLDEQQVASRILPVPTAFHTPALASAVAPFRSKLQSLPVAPPRIPLLSTVSNRFVADPDLMRDGLAEQLVTPLRFVDTIDKLAAQGITHLIEVGPQRILTRLGRLCGTTMRVLSTDPGPTASHAHSIIPLLTLQTLVDLMDLEGQSSENRGLRVAPSTPLAITQAPPVKHFDATEPRRQRRRLQSSHAKSAHYPSQLPIPAATTPTLSSAHIEPPAIQATLAQPSLQQESPATVTGDHADIERILIDFVVEQTGYPEEIVELDSDLEADLGIDSIKKAQLLGELRELFPEAIRELQAAEKSNAQNGRRGSRLAELRTLRDFVRMFATSGQAYQPVISSASQQTSEETSPHHAIPQTAGRIERPVQIAQPSEEDRQVGSLSCSERQTHGSLSRAHLEQFVIDFVVEQTGYPAEIVELDADLEADLGIDSIKKAQLLGELRETFAMKLPGGASNMTGSEGTRSRNAKANADLDRLSTLRQILDMLADQLGIGAESATEVVASITTEPPTMATPSLATGPAPSLPQPSPTIHVNSIPILTTNYRNGFAEAMRSNLHSLPARQSEDTRTTPLKSQEQQSDRSSAFNERLHRLSDHAEVSPSVITEFDSCLLTESDWEFVDPTSAEGTGDGETPSNIRWFAKLHLPNWLSDSNCRPIGVVQKPEIGLNEIITPGSAIPLAMVNGPGVIIVARAASPDIKRQLADRFSTLTTVPFVHTTLAIGQWDIAGDWSVAVGEASSGNLQLIHHRADQTSVAELDLNASAHHSTFADDAWAKIGWDSQAKAWVLAARSGSPLSGPARYRIERMSSVPSDATSAAGLGTTSYFSGFSEIDLSHQDAATESIVQKPVVSEDSVPPAAFKSESSRIAQRYVLRMETARLVDVPNRQPSLGGSAIILGDNALAKHVESRLRAAGVVAIRPSGQSFADDGSSGDEFAMARWFTELANVQKIPHLFITSAFDSDASISLNEDTWQSRRSKGLMSVFWLCQKWIEHVTNENLIDDASLIAISSMGGDFGLSGNLYSAEGGGINGLLKSMLIESWMQGIRTLPIKTIDVSLNEDPQKIVDYVWRELAVPSYDNEVAYVGGIRKVIKAVPAPLASPPSSTSSNLKPITRGATWVCTGGARGITAFAMERLAARYDLQLVLLGTAPVPGDELLGKFPLAKRELLEQDPPDDEALRQFKLQTMTEARASGKNPVKAWQAVEKQLEIANTLRRLRARGIRAEYFSCDVADRNQVGEILTTVRQTFGPIRGVLHGAGVGRDARFDRKQPDKVDQCISAKVDGALALIAQTWNDPLEVFIGFGSISGRFGANGHTDYSLANEMLCKQINWLHRQRPEVRAIGFHWHAWGDVGMATKPETKLALEMINMQFMPAEEGVQHLIDELESNSNESEILITDDRYYRAFYPAETLSVSESKSGLPFPNLIMDSPLPAIGIETPLLSPSLSIPNQWISRVNPAKDPFLTDHLLGGRPLLPFVIAAEMLRQAASAILNEPRIGLRDMIAHGPIKFFTENERDLILQAESMADGKGNADRAAKVELRSDFVSQKGVVVERRRLNFSATGFVDDASEKDISTKLELPVDVAWRPVVYPDVDSEFYAGWPLQRLRKYALLDSGLIGRISAPALVELAGVTRDTSGWAIPSAALDACLFAAGILGWARVAPGSALPVRMGRLTLGRLPRPGEACEVHVVLNSAELPNASFDFSLYGVDGSLIVNVVDYEVAWISGSPLADTESLESVRSNRR